MSCRSSEVKTGKFLEWLFLLFELRIYKSITYVKLNIFLLMMHKAGLWFSEVKHCIKLSNAGIVESIIRHPTIRQDD